MKLSNIRIFALNAIVFALLLLVSVYSYISMTNMEVQADRIVLDAIPEQNSANELLTNLLNMETGVRAYTANNDRTFLEPYDYGKSSLQKEIDYLLANADRVSPDLKPLIEGRVVPQIQQIEAHFANQIALVDQGKAEEARGRIINGKALMDGYRAIHNEILTMTAKDTKAASDRMDAAARQTRTIVIVGGVTAILVALASTVIFNRSRRTEHALRVSEEKYRLAAETLETHNEEIIAQQVEQEETLIKLTARERELEWISSYQENLTGFMQLDDFLKKSVGSLLDALSLDAAMVLIREGGEEEQFKIVYSTGFPDCVYPRVQTELYGTARRIFETREPMQRKRSLTGGEKGLHAGFEQAVDWYFPLFDDKHEMIGFLLLTQYEREVFSQEQERLLVGLSRQFGLAFFAQLMNEERHRQSEHLQRLNTELSNEKNLIRGIIESSHEGILMADPAGMIVVANSRMQDVFLLKKTFGRDIMDVFEVSQRVTTGAPNMVEQVKAFMGGMTDSLTLRYSYKTEQTSMHIEVYATPVGTDEEGRRNGFLFVFRDRSEEELVDEMKNEFISIVSHELRTPLASVLGFAEILLEREVSPDKQKRYLKTIYSEANRLSHLINDFLDLQRMESGQQAYHFTPVDLQRLVQEVGEQWKGREAHEVRVHLPEIPVMIRGDEDRLKQMLLNLISNAVKYSPGADKVDLYVEPYGGHVKLRVQDYGLGIPEEARTKLFTKFYRVDNSDRRQIGGTGLGLVICKEIIEAHDGTISYKSKMQQGTVFTIELPVMRPAVIEGKIVIVEDDDNLARLIEEGLSKLQAPTVRIRSSEEAILSLANSRKRHAALWIVDIMLEGAKTGWDFLAELYRDPVHAETPVIVSTALDPPQNYYEKEIEKYLKKPFTMERLLEVVEELIRKGQTYKIIFPTQDEQAISAILGERGIGIKEMKAKQDTIEVELEKRPGRDAAGQPPGTDSAE